MEVYNDNINIEISGIIEICKGDSVFIKVDDLTSLNPIVSYHWKSNFELNFGTDSSNFISFPDSSSWYKVTATNSLGCYISDSILYTMIERYFGISNTRIIPAAAKRK